MHGFQNSFAQVFSLRSSNAICNTGFRRLKVKVTLEGQMIKWSYIELVEDITSTFVHGFQNNFAQVFSLRSSSASRHTCTHIHLSKIVTALSRFTASGLDKKGTIFMFIF